MDAGPNPCWPNDHHVVAARLLLVAREPAAVERLDAEDTVEEATRLGTATTNLFAEIYRELAEDGPPVALAGGG